jgi:hypothetical protein
MSKLLYLWVALWHRKDYIRDIINSSPVSLSKVMAG